MNVRQKIYDKIFGDENLSTSTTNLYKLTLEKLDNNLKILDVGVGTGVYFENENCVNLIKSKNLQIHGIDINEDDINLAKRRIIDNSLDSNVSVEYKNLFDLKNIKDYDIILFSESYPVISEHLMFEMLNFIIHINEFKNTIIFINNIENNPTFLQKYKSYLKYIMFNIDYGRLVSKNDMELMFKSLNVQNIRYELLATATANYALFKDKIKLPGLNFEMKQYLIKINK